MSEQARKVKNKAIPEWAEGLYCNKGLFSEALVYHNDDALYFELRGQNSGIVRFPFEMLETVREERDRLVRELEEERRQRQADVERERAKRLEAQQSIERLAQKHAQLEEERSQVEGEARRLREELEVERSKGFWQRLIRWVG
jgi:flagellar biosynthesis GTPase FlhF